MQLRQTKAFSVLYHHNSGIRNVNSHLNNGSADKSLYLALAELFHDIVFLSRAHFSMQERSSIAVEVALCRIFGIALDCEKVALAVLNHRAHHISLSALVKSLAHETEGSVAQLSRNRIGVDRFPSVRQLSDHGNIKVAVDHKRESAWDRCRGHDKLVRRSSLFSKRRPLVNAETVLLVCDNKTESLVLNVLLDYGVSADNDIYFARSDTLTHFRLFLSGH